MAKQGKRYRELSAKVDRSRLLPPREALALVKQTASAKFDESVDVAVRLGVDVRHADQMVRGTVVLPQGTGRDVRVLVFAAGEKAKEAEAAGAEIVGADELVAKIEGGFLDFDVAIATPDMMPMVGKLGRVLGPRGLMPNPKTGTVTNDVEQAIRDAKAGKIEFRTDRGGVVHVSIGKVSFSEDALLENFQALLDALIKAKPAAAKGQYIRSITLSATMGPGIKVNPQLIGDAA